MNQQASLQHQTAIYLHVGVNDHLSQSYSLMMIISLVAGTIHYTISLYSF